MNIFSVVMYEWEIFSKENANYPKKDYPR